MALYAHITLSKKASKTVAMFPEFFEPVLNSLYELHLQHGYCKPQLSIYRDESTVMFNGQDHFISIMYLSAGQLVIHDSRMPARASYEYVTMPHDRLSTTLYSVLKSRLKSLLLPGDE